MKAKTIRTINPAGKFPAGQLKIKELAVTFATAATDLYIAYYNLSTAIDHYKAHNNLCSTIMSTLEACSNLSATTNLQLMQQSILYNTPYCINLRNP